MDQGTHSLHDFKSEYEELRNNVLGKTNRCRGLAVFLRQGMASWMRMLQAPANHETKKTRKPGNHSTGSSKSSGVTSGLAAVLVDVLLIALNSYEL